MTFKHELLPIPRGITDEIIDEKRFYTTPDGVFKSVTTIIGEKSDKEWLVAWRARVGDEEADRILQQSKVRGTAIHELAEKYVNNDPMWQRKSMPFNIITFNKIARVLDRHVDVVYGIEFPLYSKMLGTAGRTDLPARFDGVKTIVDFKTSRGTKLREDIPGYFTQAAAYAIMLEELTGVRFPQMAVIVAQDNKDEASVFVEKCRDWYPEVARIFMEK